MKKIIIFLILLFIFSTEAKAKSIIVSKSGDISVTRDPVTKEIISFDFVVKSTKAVTGRRYRTDAFIFDIKINGVADPKPIVFNRKEVEAIFDNGAEAEDCVASITVDKIAEKLAADASLNLTKDQAYNLIQSLNFAGGNFAVRANIGIYDLGKNGWEDAEKIWEFDRLTKPLSQDDPNVQELMNLGFDWGDISDMATRFVSGEEIAELLREGELNLEAIKYVGDTKVATTATTVTVGARVKNLAEQEFQNVEFRIVVTGNGYNYDSSDFKKNIPASSTKDYKFTIPSPGIAGTYNVTITVNPDNKDPEETDPPGISDNTVPGTFEIIEVIPANSNLTLIASLQELSDPLSAPWISNPITQGIYKAGYGIPLVVEVRGYNYQPKPTLCGEETYISDDVRFIPDGSEVKIIGLGGLDSYIFDKGAPGMNTLEYIKDSGSGSASSLRVRFILKPNTAYPRGYRKLYTKPTQADGLYNLTIHAKIHVQFTEHYVESCYCCQEYCACACCEVWNTRTVDDYPEATVTVKPIIKSSMFDDDQVIITR